jgi:2-haloacid dehalogenase
VAISHALFDLNGTLFDPMVMAEPLAEDEGGELVERILDDTIALAMAETLSGSYRDFSELLRAAASRRLSLAGRQERLDELMSAAAAMRPFADGRRAVEELRAAGLETGVLTNSSTETAASLLADSDLDMEPVVGTDQVRAFKPHPSVYRLGVEATGRPAEELVLVSAHSWDVLGASRAGLRTAWISRRERVAPPIGAGADIEAPDLIGAARRIAAATTRG